MKTRTKCRTKIMYGLAVPDGSDDIRTTEVPPLRVAYASAEQITYTYDGDHSSFNKCTHSDSGLTGTAYAVPARVTGWHNPSLGWTDFAECFQGVTPYALYKSPIQTWIICQPSASVAVGPSSAEVAGAKFDAYLNVRAGAPAQMMNFVRSALELKDTKQTLTSLVALMQWARHFKGLFRPWSTLTQVATAYLTYQFGVAPTVSDVRKFIDQASKGMIHVHSSPRRIRKGDIVRTYWSIKADKGDMMRRGSFTDLQQVVKDYWFGSNGTFTYNMSTRPYLPNRYNLKRFVANEVYGVAFARATQTLNLDLAGYPTEFEWRCPVARTAWDLTPFSFLVDWFIDVGTTISRMEKLNMLADVDRTLSNVWLSATTRSTTYFPVVSCHTDVSRLRRVSTSYPMWMCDIQKYCRITDYVRQGGNIMFDRAPYVLDSTALAPSIRWRLSTYQLSTGMALLTNLASNLAKSWRK